MGQDLRRGFKSEAERISEMIRDELGLSRTSPLECAGLCAHLGIPVIPLPDLLASGASANSVRCLTSATARFSALTIISGTKRLIVYNPSHPPGRCANSLAHEISHILLEHPLSSALGPGGCRRWDSSVESEADWLAGALLVPRKAALLWMQSGRSVEEGATKFGVSLELFRWRINQTGVVRQLSALASVRRRWR